MKCFWCNSELVVSQKNRLAYLLECSNHAFKVLYDAKYRRYCFTSGKTKIHFHENETCVRSYSFSHYVEVEIANKSLEDIVDEINLLILYS
jgi:hypothetical protein